jgi:hypothetical protein
MTTYNILDLVKQNTGRSVGMTAFNLLYELGYTVEPIIGNRNRLVTSEPIKWYHKLYLWIYGYKLTQVDSEES